jgi:hypothetical protein
VSYRGGVAAEAGTRDRTGAYECDEVRFAITVGCRVSCRKVNATTS